MLMGFPGHFLEHDVFTQTLILVEGERGSARSIVTTGSASPRNAAPAPIVTRRCGGPGCPQYMASHASIVPCNSHLLRALRGDAKAESTAEDNLKTMRLAFAAYESARSGNVVQLHESGAREPLRP